MSQTLGRCCRVKTLAAMLCGTYRHTYVGSGWWGGTELRPEAPGGMELGLCKNSGGHRRSEECSSLEVAGKAVLETLVCLGSPWEISSMRHVSGSAGLLEADQAT